VSVTPDAKLAGDPRAFATTLMLGAWTQKGFQMSFDGKHLLVQRFDGFSVIDQTGQARDYSCVLTFRNMFWGPDNKKFIFWLPQGVAVGDVDNLGEPCGPPKTVCVYKRSKDRLPFGAGWSPRGSDFYVLENYIEDAGNGAKKQGSAIQRVSLTGSATEILHHPTRILWFMPPLTRYEDGSGPSQRPFQILFGAADGIFLMDSDGSNKEKISDVAFEGVEDVIWGPGKENSFILMFRHPQASADKKTTYKGVYMCHLDKREKGKPIQLEQITDRIDTHTIFYSPKGKYILWATDDKLHFREPEAKPETAVEVDLKDASGMALKGCNWDAKESRIAIVCGNRVLVHDVAKKSTSLVTKLGDDVKSFGADPQWRGDEILLTLYTDVVKTSQPSKTK